MAKSLSPVGGGRPSEAGADEWIHGGRGSGGTPSSAPAPPPTAPPVVEEAAERTKRLTLDIPVSLHTRIKVGCAERGTKMVEEIREILEAHYMRETR